MERTTNFMNRIRTIARKNHFQYMVLENYAIPAVRFTPSDYWDGNCKEAGKNWEIPSGRIET